MSLFRNTHIGMGEQKFSHARIQSEAMHALASAEHQHGGRPVENIARPHLLETRLENFLKRHLSRMPRRPAQNGKDGADIDVHVNIGGTVQRVKNQNIIAAREFGSNTEEFRLLLGTHGAQRAATLHAIYHYPVGNGVHFLNVFTLDIDLASAAQNIQQTGLVDAAGNGIAGKNQIIQQSGKLSCCLRRALLVQQKVLGNGNVSHESLLDKSLKAGCPQAGKTCATRRRRKSAFSNTSIPWAKGTRSPTGQGCGNARFFGLFLSRSLLRRRGSGSRLLLSVCGRTVGTGTEGAGTLDDRSFLPRSEGTRTTAGQHRHIGILNQLHRRRAASLLLRHGFSGTRALDRRILAIQSTLLQPLPVSPLALQQHTVTAARLDFIVRSAVSSGGRAGRVHACSRSIFFRGSAKAWRACGIRLDLALRLRRRRQFFALLGEEGQTGLPWH